MHETFPSTGVVKLQSWAGLTRHRVKILRRSNRTRNGETTAVYVCEWADEACFRYSPGQRLYPPTESVEIDAEGKET